ncbi:S8 family serine peptidase [Kribbella sp. NPDC006257]|uniref:S8 family serine peptidase n=1 Tax=Kribbella sp. NPDC006257 TaxID=3156738 RepID=UPI0033A96AD9
MGSISRARRFGLPAVASLAVLGIAMSGAAQQALAAPPKPAGISKAKLKPDQHVTLLTGDRVTLHGGDPARASIEPGPGRRGVTFSAQRTNGKLYVIPSDVNPLVASGRIDRRLFEVAGLIEAGYDDKASSSIPLLVSYQGKANRSAPAGATVTRSLPVINGAAVTVDKKAGFLKGLTTARSANGIDKIWLDGKRHVTLDQSVPQIGAPTAWAAGYTGKGVSVAVLDTGIDKTHPDLATQVAGEKNFTDEQTGDFVGHGTHVASTIAGTAAASAGKYKGVAPDAKLYDGKVCELDGCPDSALLAGMEWAAKEVKAKVVNFSIGGQDTPEIDPLEQAVNKLTAETGTLFVIAAGNSGPGVGSIESPGSADAALTVGAVDKQNQLADFSSRGPRLGDGAVKPDVTAPGVDIVAAKSKDSQIGEPVGQYYLKLSGTSMATPHTVGAAAILAQEHPTWKAAELKGALMASAKVAANQTAFEQGAGRIDLTKAITASVIAEPGSVSFGTAQWPHNDDTPVTKTVTYRNLGDKPVTLALNATLTGPDGNPAPAGALSLSAHEVTVPAGGTATVQATSNTKHNGPDGGYSGRINATADGVAVTSPIGVDKEVESYTLTIKQIGPDGKPSGDSTLVFGLDEFRFEFAGDPSGTAKVRLPKGTYLLEADQYVPRDEEHGDSYLMLDPKVGLTADKTVVFDARATRPVSTTVPRKDAKLILADVGYDRYATSSLGSSALVFDLSSVHTAQVGPALARAELTGHVVSNWGKPDGTGWFNGTPYLYGIANSIPGKFPTGFSRTVRQQELATVEQVFHKTADRSATKTTSVILPNQSGAWTPILTYDLPTVTRNYLEAGPVGWTTDFAEIVPSQDPQDPFPVVVTDLSAENVQYKAGRTVHENWNTAAFVPQVGLGSRLGDELQVGIYTNTDAEGHQGFTLTDSASSKLFRNGKQVAESEDFGYIDATGLPAAKAKYKYVTTGTRTSVSGFSTRTELALTFSSAASEEETVVPMRSLRYRPAVDLNNIVKRTPVTVLPVQVDGLPGATLPKVKKLEIQVSGDNGKTWHPAAVVPVGKDGYKAVFVTPKGAKSVSLKAKLVDAGGNTTEQTTIAAYPLR